MVRTVLPEVRKRAALMLHEEGMSQNRIAEALQVSQPMVGKYLKGRPSHMAGIERYVEDMARELVGGIRAGKGMAELTDAFCRACFRMREAGAFCSVHSIEDCRVCMNLRVDESGERSDAIRDVEQAASLLESMSPGMIPEVRVNIARAVSGAEGINDVVAIPGRMTEIKGRLKALTRPEFGASRHLAGTLLSVMEEDPDVRAVINTFFSEEIEEAMKGAGLVLSERPGKGVDVIIDRGAFGREPCAYILGRSALEAAQKVMRVSEGME